MFNAEMAYLDDQHQARPYLIEALPQLNTDTWRVNPDGTMDTTYHLRPSITWHDGQPLTAEDFAFAWRVYSTPASGNANLTPFKFISSVEARDLQTVVIHWKQAYADVTFLAGQNTEFPPLPRHILEPALQTEQIDSLANNPFWTRDFVGLGPYKLDRWENGAFLEGVAFDKHVLGKAHVERVRLQFMSDARAVLASILSGDIHLTDGTSAGLPEIAVLKRQWISQGKGVALLHPNQWRAAFFQFRPEYASPKGLLNPLVRKALASSLDRQPLNDALYDGDGIISDSMFPPQSVWGAAAARGAVKYPYDARRADQLMSEAGYAKDAEGFYASPTDGRLSFEVKTNQQSDNESEVSILASGWRQLGFAAQEAVLPAAQAQDAQARATYAGLYTNSQNCCESALLGLTAASTPRAENRWAGGNRSGWTNPGFERLIDAYSRTLDQNTRDGQIGDLVHVMTDDVQSITLFIRAQGWVHVNELKGLDTIAPPEGNMSWNMPNWEFQ
jgi:peptide/nickel transport system substrate-binding protein